MSKAKKMSREMEPEDIEDIEDMGDEEMGNMEEDDIDEMDEDMMPNMPNKFWNVQLKPDEEHDLEPPAIPGFEVHITNACFSSNIKPGSRTVIVTKDEDDKEVPICVLLEGKHESQSLNLIINEGLNLSLKGKNVSAVSLTGFIAPPSDIGDMDDEGALSMDGEDENNLNDEELPPQLKEAIIRKRKMEQALEDEDQKESIEPPSKRAKIDTNTNKQPNKPNVPNKKEKNPNPKPSPLQPPQAPSSNSNAIQPNTTEKPLSKTQKKKQKKLAAKAAAINSNENNENPGAPNNNSNTTTTTTVTVVTSTQENKEDNSMEPMTMEENKEEKKIT